MAPEQELQALKAASMQKDLESHTTPGKVVKKQRLGEGSTEVKPQELFQVESHD